MQRKNIRWIFYIFLCVISFFFIHNRLAVYDWYRKYLISIVSYPIISLNHMLVKPLKNMVEHYRTSGSLNQELQQLRSEKKYLLQELIKLQSHMLYIKNTEEIIDYAQHYEQLEKKLVHMLAKNITDKEHYCIIDAGSVHGVTIDMVAVYKNCIIGRIDEVFPFYSKVCLITDKRCKIAATCVESSMNGIYEGNNKNGGSLQFVSHLNTVINDDMVLSSGQGLIFPEGFAIGKIETSQQEGLHYIITVKPLIDINQLDYCYLIKKGNFKV